MFCLFAPWWSVLRKKYMSFSRQKPESLRSWTSRTSPRFCRRSLMSKIPLLRCWRRPSATSRDRFESKSTKLIEHAKEVELDLIPAVVEVICMLLAFCQITLTKIGSSLWGLMRCGVVLLTPISAQVPPLWYLGRRSLVLARPAKSGEGKPTGNFGSRDAWFLLFFLCFFSYALWFLKTLWFSFAKRVWLDCLMLCIFSVFFTTSMYFYYKIL